MQTSSVGAEQPGRCCYHRGPGDDRHCPHTSPLVLCAGAPGQPDGCAYGLNARAECFSLQCEFWQADEPTNRALHVDYGKGDLPLCVMCAASLLEDDTHMKMQAYPRLEDLRTACAARRLATHGDAYQLACRLRRSTRGFSNDGLNAFESGAIAFYMDEEFEEFAPTAEHARRSLFQRKSQKFIDAFFGKMKRMMYITEVGEEEHRAAISRDLGIESDDTDDGRLDDIEDAAPPPTGGDDRPAGPVRRSPRTQLAAGPEAAAEEEEEDDEEEPGPDEPEEAAEQEGRPSPYEWTTSRVESLRLPRARSDESKISAVWGMFSK